MISSRFLFVIFAFLVALSISKINTFCLLLFQISPMCTLWKDIYAVKAEEAVAETVVQAGISAEQEKIIAESKESFVFQAEVNRLMNIIINSLCKHFLSPLSYVRIFHNLNASILQIRTAKFSFVSWFPMLQTLWTNFVSLLSRLLKFLEI